MQIKKDNLDYVAIYDPESFPSSSHSLQILLYQCSALVFSISEVKNITHWKGRSLVSKTNIVVGHLELTIALRSVPLSSDSVVFFVLTQHQHV